ncbi:SDR family oxidoreductase [Streptomyces sp. G2]|uniref:SDR family NAD(P)-dependent oxidoreductase n=1 Tax=Streptomyces sp. G2 TaxID=1684471 RepID=UPI00202FBDC7|nr:SDR family oxidoreductase [Streptomyces sp. G2]MCM1946088.1 SDR family oxidoreductase [Streptomyces sp. G2]
MRRLEGKVALVSGTARNPGKAAALRFEAEGALVVAGDLLHEEALETQRQIGREGGTALAPGPVDVTRPASVEGWVAEAAEAFGGIDIVLAHAGTLRLGFLAQESHDDSPATVDPVWLIARAARPHLVRSRGCVVTIGSTAGIRASLSHHRTARHDSKGGVGALTRRLAAEGSAHGIRANCVSLGPVDTEGARADLLAEALPPRDSVRPTPLDRLGTPQDIARVAAFLASEEASSVSGAHLVVDGGWSAVLPDPLT